MTKRELITRKVQNIFVTPRIPIGVFVIFIILTAVLIWCASSARTQSNNQLPRTHTVGEMITMSDTVITLETVRRDTLGAGPLVPRPGNEFVITTIMLKNTSAESYEFMPLLSLHLKDSRGNVYPVVAVPSNSTQLSGPLAPYDTIREEVGFEVTKNAEGLTLLFEPGTPEHEVVLISLDPVQTVWGHVISLFTSS